MNSSIQMFRFFLFAIIFPLLFIFLIAWESNFTRKKNSLCIKSFIWITKKILFWHPFERWRFGTRESNENKKNISLKKKRKERKVWKVALDKIRKRLVIARHRGYLMKSCTGNCKHGHLSINNSARVLIKEKYFSFTIYWRWFWARSPSHRHSLRWFLIFYWRQTKKNNKHIKLW